MALRPPPPLLWLGLGCLALVESNDLPNRFNLPRVTDPLVATLVFVALLLAFAAFALAIWAMSRQPRGAPAGMIRMPSGWSWAKVVRWLWYPLLLWLALAAAQSVSGAARTLATYSAHWPPLYMSDDLYDNQYNALLALRGENPYVGDHLAASLNYFHTNGYTPVARGRFSSPFSRPTVAEVRAILAAYRAHPSAPPPEVEPLAMHSYPAGAFLVDAPFVWVGLPSMTPVQFALWLAFVLGLLALAPPSWRLTIALLALSNAAALDRILMGDFDIWWIVPLVMAWWLSSARLRSAALVGVACAIKQLAWFLAPFYLMWIWRALGGREALRRGAIALAAFLLLNLPWLLQSPRAWLTSLFLPVSLPLLPEGAGLTGLVLAHVPPLFPRPVYTALEVAAMLALLAPRATRHAPRAPMLGLVLGLAPVVLAWRADERYFLPLSLLAIAAVVLSATSCRRVNAMTAEHVRPALQPV
jgi:hypothetical protein